MRRNKNGELALQFSQGYDGYMVDGKYNVPPSAFITNNYGDSIRLNTNYSDFDWNNGTLTIRKNNSYSDGRITSGVGSKTALWLNLNTSSSYSNVNSNQWFSMFSTDHYALTLNTTDTAKKYINIDSNQIDNNALTLRLDSNVFFESDSKQNELNLVGSKTSTGKLFIGDANNTVSGTQQAVVLDYNTDAFSMTQTDASSTYKLQLNTSDQFEFVSSQLTIKDGLTFENLSGTVLTFEDVIVDSSLDVSGSVSISGEVNITNGKYLHSDDINTPNLMVSGGGTGLTCPGNAKFEGTTNVFGPITVHSGVSLTSDAISTPALTVSDSSTGLVAIGNVNLSGPTTVSNGLVITTAALSATNVAATDNSTFDKLVTSSGLSVTATSSLNDLNVSGSTVLSGSLTASNVTASSITSTGTVDATGQTINSADIVNTGTITSANLNMESSGSAIFNGSLVTSGSSVLAGDVSISGVSTITGASTITTATVTSA